MSNRRNQTNNGEIGPQRIRTWRLPAIISALLTAVLLGFGCNAENAADEVQRSAVATPVPVSSASSASPTATLRGSGATKSTGPTETAASATTHPQAAPPKVAALPTDARASAMTADDFPVPPDRDLLELARQMRWKGIEPEPSATSESMDWEVGDVREFWTLDYPRRTMVSSEFQLVAISDSAYWWSDSGEDLSGDDTSRTVAAAEEQVFPRVEAVFASGQEPEQIHVINGRIPGVGGYVSGSDQYPSSAAPYSNEVTAIYINTRAAAYGDERLLNILAHELQHVIHQIADESEATWLNEGLAELAVSEAGYRGGSVYHYLRRPDASLVNWPDDLSSNVGLNYGAASLFAHYVREHYAPTGGLQDLLAIESDGIVAVDEFLTLRGAQTTGGSAADFHTVFADWMVANLLDQDSGRHGYEDLDIQASITVHQDADNEGYPRELAQYGVDYVHIRDVEDQVIVHFEGLGTAPLLPTEVDGECWWSNRGDTISATLSRSLKVPATASDGSEPKVTYRYWHDIEEEWDYLYVSVSVDNGRTWDVLQAAGTTDANPVGNSYGYGYTSDSGGWQDGEASLSLYAGRDALVRFHYVTDDAINGPGMCVQDIKITGDADVRNTADWVPDGFVRVNSQVRQDWIVWVIVDGPENSSSRMNLTWDAESERVVGSLMVDSTPDGRLVVAVAPIAPATMQPGSYSVWAEAQP